MRLLNSRAVPVIVGAIAAWSIWILVGAVDHIGRTFPGFLLLENGVVASAGLTYWPAASDGSIFQMDLVEFDGRPYRNPDDFRNYISSLPGEIPVDYTFDGPTGIAKKAIDTRKFSRLDAVLLFGATFVSALALLGVALALRYLAPDDPASGCAASLAIAGVWALTALDLYGPYHFFRVHAFAECLLAAGSVHMALVFPYPRSVVKKCRMLIPGLYASGAALGLVAEFVLFDAAGYRVTHRIAVDAAGISFAVLITSQVLAYVRPVSLAARQRITVLAMGTVASMTPGFAVLLFGTVTGGGAVENAVGWAGALFPISIAYAVLRADLLQVDSILRRTVSYATVTVLVGLSYAGLVGGVESLASGQSAIPRWVSILVFSCFCTFALSPIRDRIQSVVDRLFFRSVYDFRATTEETSRRLARLIHLDQIRSEIESAVTTALQPELVQLDVYPKEAEAKGSEPEPPLSDSVVEDRNDGGIVVNFRSHNRLVATLLLGRRLSGRFYSGEDRALLAILANQGAVAIENALAIEEVHELNRTLEKRVVSRTAELAQTLDELTKTQGQLVQAERLAAVGEIAAGVAHEVNNPLNFARNSLRTLEVLVRELAEYSAAIAPIGASSDDEAIELLTSIRDKFCQLDVEELSSDVIQLTEILGSGLDRTARLVADLRDFASPKKAISQPFNLEHVISSCVDLTQSTLDSEGIEVSIAVPADLPLAEGDGEAMGQVMLNVIKNSIDALRGYRSPKITIRACEAEEGNNLMMTISDNGPGVDSEVAERIFEPFFTTKQAGEGTGLGLALCQRIIQEHAGEIWVSSLDPHGLSVHLSIPALPIAREKTLQHNPTAP